MARWDSEPLPIEAKLYLPGFFLSSATSSTTELTPSSRLTASRLGWVTSWVTGAMSLRGSRQTREQQGIDGKRPANAHAECRAVGRGFGDHVGAEIAAGAGLVLDQKCAGRIFLLQSVGDQ